MIKATNNGNTNTSDNSDFTVQASSSSVPTRPGHRLWFRHRDPAGGRDGKGPFDPVLDPATFENGLRTASAQPSPSPPARTIPCSGRMPQPRFKLEFTPATGEAEFFQYQRTSNPLGDGDIDFQIQVVDGDVTPALA